MPILNGSVTFARFRVDPAGKPPSDLRRWFLKGLKSSLFEPIDRKDEEDRSAGFAELENTEGTDFAVSNVFYGERALCCWRVDQLKIPGAQAKEELKRWAQAFEREHRRKPARSEKGQARRDIRDQLRKRAVPVTKTHDLAWDLKAQQLQIWSASRKVVEEIVLAVESGFEVKLMPLIPGALATREGIADNALLPTAILVGVEAAEVTHGAA